MPSIGQELLGRRLAPGDLERHRVGSEEPRHHGRSPCGACRRAGAASSCFRPKRPGYGYRAWCGPTETRSEEHTSELQSLMRISYAVFCLKKKKKYYTDIIA